MDAAAGRRYHRRVADERDAWACVPIDDWVYEPVLGDNVRAALARLPRDTARLAIMTTRPSWGGFYSPVIEAIAASGLRPRHLRLGDRLYPDTDNKHEVPEDYSRDGWSSVADFGDLDPLWRLPGLESLTLHADDFRLGDPSQAVTLESLVIRCEAMDPKAVRALGQTSMPALQRMEIWLGTYDYSCGGVAEDVRPLLEARGFPALRTLELHADIHAELEAMARAGPAAERRLQIRVKPYRDDILVDLMASAGP